MKSVWSFSVVSGATPCFKSTGGGGRRGVGERQKKHRLRSYRSGFKSWLCILGWYFKKIFSWA